MSPGRPADRPRPAPARGAPGRARRARPPARCRRGRADERQVPGSRLLRGARPRLAADLASRRASRRPRVSGARQAAAEGSARATSSAPPTGGSSTSCSATRLPSRWCRRPARGEEFSIDVFCGVDRRCLAAIPRTMIESKGGESIKGASIKDSVLIEVGRRVAETLGIVGPATVQCFRTADGRHEITDVNVRFGGGFPVHHASRRRLSGARPRARPRRAAGAPARRVPRRRRHDSLLLADVSGRRGGR